MAQEHVVRKLTAIFYADVAGYSRLTGEDEEGTHRRVSACLNAITNSIKKHNGTVLHFAGDAVLADFTTVSDALICAVNTQNDLKNCNIELPDDRKVRFRIGINLGEVIVDRGEIFGNGVNVAARLESLAEPGGICISSAVRDAVGRKLPLDYEEMGEQSVKNIAEPVRAYAVRLKPDAVLPAPSKRKTAWFTRRVIAATAAAVAIVIAAGLAWLQPWAPEFEPASVERMTYPLPDKPSTAVLPFDNIGEDTKQNYIADGLTESLIVSLSKVPQLFVIARNSTFTYKGKPVKVQQIAEDLGVRYVLEGSVQRIGEKLRITAQLIDALSGKHLWAESYDRKFTDLFELQDDVVKKVLVELQVKLSAGDHARLVGGETDNLEAYLLREQAMAEGFKFTREGFIRARELFQAAHEADPSWARPLAGIAWTHERETRLGWSKSREASIRTGMELARRAIDMAPKEQLGYMMLGNLYFATGDYSKAIALREKALELAPNDFNAIVGLAGLLYRGGEPRRALDLFERAKRVSPRYPWWVLVHEGTSLHLVGQHERAIQALKEAIRRKPKRADSHIRLAAVFADLGRISEAKEEIKVALELDRKFTSKLTVRNILEFRVPKTANWYSGLLRSAGLPD